MAELGYEVADIIRVKIGDAEMLMPIGTAYNDADSGEFICCFRTNSSGVREVTLAIDLGDLASTIGIERRAVVAEPGYEWDYDAHATVAISMAQKQGYAEEYALHQIIGTRTNKREDYPNLSDAEFANFRVVEIGGMGKGMLYRSSSPVNPVIKRNREADAALGQALVRTVMNMSDDDATMRKYEGFSQTHCAGCDIIPLEMSMDVMDEMNRQKLAEGFRYIAAHDGPYLIHCNEGKDRTGFAVAVLGCLMGASIDEIVADYMLTFYNFYGVRPEDEQYALIARKNIETSLARSFGVESIRGEGVDLRACAEAYLEAIGMRAEEISTLKAKLAEDCGKTAQ